MFGRRGQDTGEAATAVLESGAVRVPAAAGTVVGNKYRANFDVLGLAADIRLAAVADGMGDGPGSTAAGQTTMAEFTAAIRRAAVARVAPGPALLRETVARIQDLVLAEAAGLEGFTGCTLTALVAEAPGPGTRRPGSSRSATRAPTACGPGNSTC